MMMPENWCTSFVSMQTGLTLIASKLKSRSTSTTCRRFEISTLEYYFRQIEKLILTAMSYSITFLSSISARWGWDIMFAMLRLYVVPLASLVRSWSPPVGGLWRFEISTLEHYFRQIDKLILTGGHLNLVRSKWPMVGWREKVSNGHVLKRRTTRKATKKATKKATRKDTRKATRKDTKRTSNKECKHYENFKPLLLVRTCEQAPRVFGLFLEHSAQLSRRTTKKWTRLVDV